MSPSTTDLFGEPMLSTREAAQRAGVSIDVLTAWRVRGLIHAMKVAGRWGFECTDLDATLKQLHAGNIRPRWQIDPLRCGTRLRSLREAAGMSQRDLARSVGLSADQVPNLERGRSSPRGATIRRLAASFGVLVEAFVMNDPNHETVPITTREAASRLGVRPISVRRRLILGPLPAPRTATRDTPNAPGAFLC